MFNQPRKRRLQQRDVPDTCCIWRGGQHPPRTWSDVPFQCPPVYVRVEAVAQHVGQFERLRVPAGRRLSDMAPNTQQRVLCAWAIHEPVGGEHRIVELHFAVRHEKQRGFPFHHMRLHGESRLTHSVLQSNQNTLLTSWAEAADGRIVHPCAVRTLRSAAVKAGSYTCTLSASENGPLVQL